MEMGKYGWGTLKRRCWTSFVGSEELLKGSWSRGGVCSQLVIAWRTAPEAGAPVRRPLHDPHDERCDSVQDSGTERRGQSFEAS